MKAYPAHQACSGQRSRRRAAVDAILFSKKARVSGSSSAIADPRSMAVSSGDHAITQWCVAGSAAIAGANGDAAPAAVSAMSSSTAAANSPVSSTCDASHCAAGVCAAPAAEDSSPMARFAFFLLGCAHSKRSQVSQLDVP